MKRKYKVLVFFTALIVSLSGCTMISQKEKSKDRHAYTAKDFAQIQAFFTGYDPMVETNVKPVMGFVKDGKIVGKTYFDPVQRMKLQEAQKAGIEPTEDEIKKAREAAAKLKYPKYEVPEDANGVFFSTTVNDESFIAFSGETPLKSLKEKHVYRIHGKATVYVKMKESKTKFDTGEEKTKDATSLFENKTYVKLGVIDYKPQIVNLAPVQINVDEGEKSKSGQRFLTLGTMDYTQKNLREENHGYEKFNLSFEYFFEGVDKQLQTVIGLDVSVDESTDVQLIIEDMVVESSEVKDKDLILQYRREVKKLQEAYIKKQQEAKEVKKANENIPKALETPSNTNPDEKEKPAVLPVPVQDPNTGITPSN